MASSSPAPGTFGSCCKDLKDAMTAPGQRFFWIAEQDILYLAVAAVETAQGTGYMDQAVLFCPFCGTSLQTAEEIRQKSEAGSTQVQ